MPILILTLLLLAGLLMFAGGLLIHAVDQTQGFRGGNDNDFENHGHE